MKEHENPLAGHAGDILDAVVDAIITIDATGRIQSANLAAVGKFGYAVEELVGQPITMLMPEPWRTEHQQYVDNYLHTKNAKIIGVGRELAAQTKSGEVVPIYLAISEIETESGTFFAGILRDLSEQKRSEAALMEQREKLSQVARLSTMGEMTASIAHEINQPLTAISMYAQACIKMLDRAEMDRDKVCGALDKLNDQALRAGSVIERIQRFVRHEDGERRTLNVNDLVTELTQLAAGDARLHGMELVFDLAEDLPNVFCDSIQVQQVALNLLRNAIDATVEVDAKFGNQVLVRTRLVGGAVEIAVVDCGVGVADDEVDQVFSAFHTTKKDGMGMGLSICRSIVEEHGGRLDFRNNEEHGCTFYFTLPVLEDE